MAAACVALAAGGARAAPPDSPWGAAYFPDVPLVTQDGEEVRFYDDLVKDRFVVINFVFTRCTKACPLETANLARVQKLLGPRVGRDIFMYSISLDPEHDTPEALKAYARRFQAGPGWSFLTGARRDIDLIRAKLGDRSRLENHAVGLALGNDPKGQWTTLSAVDNPGFLAMSIEEWMTVDPGRHAPVKSYAEAPRFVPERGEDLFRKRCAACHTIGRGDSVGPDLAGVTRRRDRGWLTRWLLDPARMIEQRDPLAMELYAKHRALPMPSLRVTEQQVADLISFLEERSGTGSAAPPGP
jgi:protein SCO1/2